METRRSGSGEATDIVATDIVKATAKVGAKEKLYQELEEKKKQMSEKLDLVEERLSEAADAINPKTQFEQHPITAVIGAVGVGFVVGLLTGGLGKGRVADQQEAGGEFQVPQSHGRPSAIGQVGSSLVTIAARGLATMLFRRGVASLAPPTEE